MSYGSNWFKGCREIFAEAMERGTIHDFFVLDVILYRCRYNGNRQHQALGVSFIGLAELGKLVRASRKEVEGSIKRLEKSGVLKVVSKSNQGTTIQVLIPQLFMDVRENESEHKVTTARTNIDKNRIDKNNKNTVVAPLVDKIHINKWEDIRGPVIASAMERHGYSQKFCEDRWEELMAYDEHKPYKNRKSGAVNWFNSHITKEKWEKAKPEKSFLDKVRDCGIEI